MLSGLLAEKLVRMTKESYRRLDSVFYTNSGAESVEGALKFARAATGRDRFVYLDHAFHGLTLGALSVNGSEHFYSGFGKLLPAARIPPNNINRLERELKKGDVAAFIAEPIQDKGVYVPDPGLLPAAQELCRRHGALCIVDEVQAGLGRTGRFFCGEYWNLDPDIVTVSKALSGGYIPVGAIILRRDIHKKVFSDLERCVVHSNAFGMNEMAMGAGLAMLETLEEEDLVSNAAEVGSRLISGLKDISDGHEMVKEVRGKGLMIGIEFGPPRSMKLKAGWSTLEKVQKGLFAQMVVMALMQEHSFLTQVSGHRVNIIKFLPPLGIGEKEIDYALEASDKVLAQAHRFPVGPWRMAKDLVKGAFSR